MNEERRLTNIEISTWEERLKTCYNYSVEKIRDDTAKRFLVSDYVEDIVNAFRLQIVSYIHSRYAEAYLFNLRYGDKQYNLRHITLEAPVIPEIETAVKQMEKDIDSLKNEYNSMMDILYSHPAKEDLDTLRKWVDTHKQEEIRCGQS